MYQFIDADGHYYEPDDFCTRHIDPAYRDRTIHIVRESPEALGEVFLGDRPMGVTAKHICDGIPLPGAARGGIEGRKDNTLEESAALELVRASDIPSSVDRDARLATMDEQGVEALVLYPSVGLQIWPSLAALGPDALYANQTAFNRFLEDDWGYDYQGRIFAAPVMVLIEPDAAVAELERVLAAGARVIDLVGCSPRMGALPGDRRFDPFWARVEEAGLMVGMHAAAADYADLYSPPGHRTSYEDRDAVGWLFDQERQVMDTLGSLVLGDVFGRFPRLSIMSVELGSAWVPYLLGAMDRAANKSMLPFQATPSGEAPSEVFRRHVFVQAFESDDMIGLADSIGVDRILFGSDFPHPEGLPRPADYLDSLKCFSEPHQRQIMRDNLGGILGLAS